VLIEGYVAELRAFARVRRGIEIDQDRQKRWRITSDNLGTLQGALSAFADEMLEGDQETRLLIYYDPRVRGSITRSPNNELSPHNWDDISNRVMLDGGRFQSSHISISANPELALLRVTRTLTKSGTEAYSIKQITRRDVLNDGEIGEAGKLLVCWTPTDVRVDAWWQVKSFVIPYSESTAAQINLLMERLVGVAYDLSSLRQEDHGQLFTDQSKSVLEG
jgi:hypothetical protein